MCNMQKLCILSSSTFWINWNNKVFFIVSSIIIKFDNLCMSKYLLSYDISDLKNAYVFINVFLSNIIIAISPTIAKNYFCDIIN